MRRNTCKPLTAARLDQRAHEQRVEQDAERNRDPELRERDQREHGQHSERPGEDDARHDRVRAADDEE